MAAKDSHQPEPGPVALITGAARRIGAALARGLHEDGYRVVIHYRGSGAEAGQLREELESRRADSAAVLQADLTDTAALPDLVDRAIGCFGSLDVLINNASSFYPTPVGTITEAHWTDLVGSNLKAPLFLSQAAAPMLRERRGSIINMVDIHARRPLPDHPVYTAAKAGLMALTLSLARDLGPEVRVNGIAPGPILWPESGADEASRKQILAETCLGRSGDPADIVGCARYLLSAGYVTGQIIAVDGGRSLGW
ncbi:MAG: pteridine reductase [Gammaproteobacteria bacterium]|jgi:pteridine reductase